MTNTNNTDFDSATSDLAIALQSAAHLLSLAKSVQTRLTLAHNIIVGEAAVMAAEGKTLTKEQIEDARIMLIDAQQMIAGVEQNRATVTVRASRVINALDEMDGSPVQTFVITAPPRQFTVQATSVMDAIIQFRSVEGDDVVVTSVEAQ